MKTAQKKNKKLAVSKNRTESSLVNGSNEIHVKLKPLNCKMQILSNEI